MTKSVQHVDFVPSDVELTGPKFHYFRRARETAASMHASKYGTIFSAETNKEERKKKNMPVESIGSAIRCVCLRGYFLFHFVVPRDVFVFDVDDLTSVRTPATIYKQ